MAKTRITSSEKSVKECFIEVTGQASFKTSIEPDNRDCKDDGTSASSNVEVTLSATTNASDRTSLEIPIKKTTGIREESLDLTDDSGSSKFPEVQKPGGETGDEDKSDYGAESFCSDDSFKGSEVTNVTSRSSLSGCSSLLLHSTGLKYDKRMTDLIKSRRSGDWGRRGEEEGNEEEEENEEGWSLSESEIKFLSESEGTVMINRRQFTGSGRRNMSFTNEELRKIERENQLLLKKIMSHHKPQNKSVKPVSGVPRTSSSAINRRRQQKKIEEDNMILLRRIQQAKPCAMPRTSAPGCKLGTM